MPALYDDVFVLMPVPLCLDSAYTSSTRNNTQASPVGSSLEPLTNQYMKNLTNIAMSYLGPVLIARIQ